MHIVIFCGKLQILLFIVKTTNNITQAKTPTMLRSNSKRSKEGIKSSGDKFDTDTIFAEINIKGADINVQATIALAIKSTSRA
uniref:Putative secreted protein n=1 Tax=Panstrongylus lignarius TaxID=156445 RepID=A0A224Y306_9HEMI